MCDRERSVSPIFHNLTCATDSDRASPASITSSSNGSETSLNACSTHRRSTKGQQRPDYKRRVKPPYSYVEMIGMAIKSTSSGRMTLRDITDYMKEQFPCFRGEYVGWKNSVRHNLSASECFTKILRDSSRPYGKDNFWTLNEKCEHCKNNRENDAACSRILAIKRSRSPASSESATKPAASHQTKLLNHPTNEMTNYKHMLHVTNNATPEAHYEDRYYDQHSYTAHHGSRRQHRYRPYTPPYSNHTWQHGRHPAAQQGTNNVDDLATLDDLYVPAHDIDFSMYNDSESHSGQSYQIGKDGKLHVAQPYKSDQQSHVPYTMYHPTGFRAYEPFYYPYVDYHHPTPYQRPPQDQHDWRRAAPVDSKIDGYVYPHPYDFAQQDNDTPSLPSSPVSTRSSDSSSPDSTVFAPASLLSIVCDTS